MAATGPDAHADCDDGAAASACQPDSIRRSEGQCRGEANVPGANGMRPMPKKVASSDDNALMREA